jgi:hypothetical protein
MNDKYLGHLKYGNILINILPQVVPLILWTYFIYKYYYTYYKNQTNYSFIFLLLLLLPFIIVLIQIIINFNKIFNTNKLMEPNIWQTCLTLSNKDSNNINDVFGIWSYECGLNQINAVKYLMKELQYKFYYLNFTLFLLILIYRKFIGLATTKNKYRNSRVIFCCIALLCGCFGVLPNSFGGAYLWSLMSLMIFSTILNMNIAAFLIVLYTLYI